MAYRLPEGWTGRISDWDGITHFARSVDPVENHSHKLYTACREHVFDVEKFVAPWPVSCLRCWTAFAEGD